MERKWWKEAVVYQIYPRSFKDSNGDGVGDLPGIIEKLDYLAELGIDVIWLSPVYKSPNDDNGYDISDYRDIMEEFGTMADMERLITEAHRRRIKILMDLVVNHTSDEHPWFKESGQSKENPYRDFYIWKKGRSGEDDKKGSLTKEPNNWSSRFGGSAWEYDQRTGEYYLHLFTRKQPDLNWTNPRVREEIYEMMTWWLEKGIDGFRMDVINMLSKDPDFPDDRTAPDKKYGDGSPYFINDPEVHAYLQEMYDRVLSHYDIMTVGETPGNTPREAARYVNQDRGELNMVFHFEMMDLDRTPGFKWKNRKWKLTEMKQIFKKWYLGLKEQGWNSLYLNNHDQPRMVSRFGDDGRYRKESAKLLASLLHTMPGTPYIYQGEELGMTNVEFDSIEDYRDVETLNRYRLGREEGLSEEKLISSININSRDNARTPMQWDDSPRAGFTTGEPWIKVNPNYPEINAKLAVNDPDSIYHYYRRLIELRKENPVIVYGDYQPLLEDNQQLFCYLRTLSDDKLLVVLNFYSSPAEFILPETVNFTDYQLLLSNYQVDEDELTPVSIKLRPYEARLYRLV